MFKLIWLKCYCLDVWVSLCGICDLGDYLVFCVIGIVLCVYCVVVVKWLWLFD